MYMLRIFLISDLDFRRRIAVYRLPNVACISSIVDPSLKAVTFMSRNAIPAVVFSLVSGTDAPSSSQCEQRV